MKLTRLLPVLTGTLALSACAFPWQVAEVQDALKVSPSGGTAFTRALTEEYQIQTNYEIQAENEWRHALIFARKANRAAGGDVVAPEDPAAWDIPSAEAAKTLADARIRLLSYFAQGARERVPAVAARAQANFDCWLEEEWEGDNSDLCRGSFLAAEPMLKAPVAATAPTPPRIIKTFVVYFDFNTATITPEAKKVLDEVAAAQAELKPMAIFLAGHTDTVGNAAYNQALSNKRAAAVAAALAKVGVKTSTFDLKAFGKTKLAVPTKDNIKEGKNRRVEIYFEK